VTGDQLPAITGKSRRSCLFPACIQAPRPGARLVLWWHCSQRQSSGAWLAVPTASSLQPPKGEVVVPGSRSLGSGQWLVFPLWPAAREWAHSGLVLGTALGVHILQAIILMRSNLMAQHEGWGKGFNKPSIAWPFTFWGQRETVPIACLLRRCTRRTPLHHRRSAPGLIRSITKYRICAARTSGMIESLEQFAPPGTKSCCGRVRGEFGEVAARSSKARDDARDPSRGKSSASRRMFTLRLAQWPVPLGLGDSSDRWGGLI